MSAYVVGLAELRRDLRQLGDTEGLAEVRDALRSAARLVADDARRRIPVKTGLARDSVRPTVSGNRAFVRGGRTTVPYYGWLDFGSRRPRSGQPRSVGPWALTGRGPDRGRFIYAAIDDRIDDVVRLVGNSLDAFARRKGLD